jgi:hypothetical protein
MNLLKKTEIVNNDVYILGKSKNYIIINDNYEGILVYDDCLNIQYQLVIDEDLMIYKCYTSILNDYLVLIDVDNEKMHIINVNKEIKSIQTIICKEILLSYYSVNLDKNTFSVVANNHKYSYSYNNGELISKEKIVNTRILCNYQEETLLYNEDSIVYSTNSKEMVFPIVHDGYKFIIDNQIIAYDEHSIKLCESEAMHELLLIKDEYSIREIRIGFNKVYVLLNSKKSVYENKIEIYEL